MVEAMVEAMVNAGAAVLNANHADACGSRRDRPGLRSDDRMMAGSYGRARYGG